MLELFSALIYVALPSFLLVKLGMKLWVLLSITLGLELLGLMLLGIPGAAFLELLQPALRKIQNTKS
jgi:hypothetical protein